MEHLHRLSNEQRDELLDTFNMCYFNSKTEKKAFWSKVWTAGEVEPNETITQDSYEMCLLRAKEILLERGIAIFTRKKRIHINKPFFKY